MKSIVLSAFLSVLVLSVTALPSIKIKGTNELFKKGQTNLQLGVGLVPVYSVIGSEYTLFGKVVQSKAIVMGARLEYGLTNNIGVGAYLGYSAPKVTITDVTNENNKYGFNNLSIILGPQVSYHIKMSGRLDPYAVGMVGVNVIKAKAWAADGAHNFIDKTKKMGIAYSIGFGANLMFSETVGMYVEVGYGTTIANAGLVAKF